MENTIHTAQQRLPKGKRNMAFLSFSAAGAGQQKRKMPPLKVAAFDEMSYESVARVDDLLGATFAAANNLALTDLIVGNDFQRVVFYPVGFNLGGNLSFQFLTGFDLGIRSRQHKGQRQGDKQ
jgi:hypothetical protein